MWRGYSWHLVQVGKPLLGIQARRQGHLTLPRGVQQQCIQEQVLRAPLPWARTLLRGGIAVGVGPGSGGGRACHTWAPGGPGRPRATLGREDPGGPILGLRGGNVSTSKIEIPLLQGGGRCCELCD